jgi:hypothetical protein
MNRPRQFVLLTSPVLLVGLVAVLLHACMDEASESSTIPEASAATRFRLTLADSGSTAAGNVVSDRGGISCQFQPGRAPAGVCSVRYRANALVTLTASPGVGAALQHWSGCTVASENPLSCHVVMKSDLTVKVTFGPAANVFELRIAGGAGGNGTVRSTPAGINCTITAGVAGATGCAASFVRATAVNLSATASSGSFLKAWAGGGCETHGSGAGGSTGTCAVTMSQAYQIVVSFEFNTPQAGKGAWSAPIPWPLVAIHAHLLPNGRVLTWGRASHDPVLWDPANPTAFGGTARPSDFFCSGHAFLSDGRLLVTGGHSGTDNFGLRTSYVYDFALNSWTRGADMRDGRWYPSSTALPDGEALTVSGGDTAGLLNLVPEVRQTDGTWRTLTNVSINLPYYSFMFVAPDGRVFAAGPSHGTRYITTAGAGAIAMGPPNLYGVRDYGTAVMYQPGKILMVGGNTTPTATAEVIDLNAGSAAAWRYVASMSVGRRQLNATLLADGKVLVTGGTNAAGFNTAPTDSRVMDAELWDPATEQWTRLARMSHPRLYHSVALLLPDARVLSTGSGEPTAVSLTPDFTAEIFSPPYLFRSDGTPAPRPLISSAPTTVSYGQPFTVQTPVASDIGKVTWVRLSSVTHSFNQNQRINTLSFVASGTSTLRVTAPADSRSAPPGHYLLFLINRSGVPSVARIVRIL